MKINLTHALAATLTALVFAPASAQTGASDGKPLHIVVPFAPGGAQDSIARYFGNMLGPRLGVPVIVENKAGAAGVIAADAVAKSPPDGNTVLLATGGAISIAPHASRKLPYDPKRDFASVAMLADTPMTIAVRMDSPFKNVADVLREAKAKPGQVAFASTGSGSVSHLTGELFAQTAGVQLLHVPYRGAGPALNDLLAAQVPLIVTSATSVEPMVEAKRVRVLASFTSTRLSSLIDAPTISEAAGIKGLEVPVWVGVLAPAKTSAERVEKLAAEFIAICKLPETLERFKTLGAIPACAGPKQLDKIVSDDTQRWGRVIVQGNLKLD